jgi:hypothetical protein
VGGGLRTLVVVGVGRRVVVALSRCRVVSTAIVCGRWGRSRSFGGVLRRLGLSVVAFVAASDVALPHRRWLRCGSLCGVVVCRRAAVAGDGGDKGAVVDGIVDGG